MRDSVPPHTEARRAGVSQDEDPEQDLEALGLLGRAPRNRVLILSTLASLVLLVAGLALSPARQVFELRQLNVTQVMLSIALALLPLLSAEGAKLRRRRISGPGRASRGP